MTSVSLSQLKMNPAKVILAASDYPVAIENRSKVQAYMIGKELFERLEKYLEDFTDDLAVKSTDFSKGRDFEEVAKKLGI
jgi:PHD/YefM family antitoxin component YafN of YafNO toxin-antitoxin module